MRKRYSVGLSVCKVSLNQMEPHEDSQSLGCSGCTPEHLPGSLSEILPTTSRAFLGTSITLLPPGAFRLSVIYSFYLPSFPAPHAFGSQTAGDVVISKFDMHVYTSVLTSDEVNNLVAEYAIPLDLHPCVPHFGLTMNRLLADKIGRSRQYFQRVLYESEALEGLFFLIDRRAIPGAMPWRNQDSSVADSAPTGVRAEDIQWLCENVIDFRPVHLAMLYAVGRTTIWKHVGHHPVFKDGEGTGNVIFLKFPMAGVVRVGKGTTLAANEAIPQHTTLPIPSDTHIPEKALRFMRSLIIKGLLNMRMRASSWGKEKPKRPRIEQLIRELPPEAFLSEQRRRKQSPCPLLSEFTTKGDGLTQGIVLRMKDDTERRLGNVDDTTKVNSPFSGQSPRSQHSNPSNEDMRRVSSSSRGSHRQAFPRRNPDESGIGSFFYLVISYCMSLTIDLDLVHLGCVKKEEDLTEKLASMKNERDDLLDKDREKEERIQWLEADLASKTSSLTEAESAISMLKGDLECLTRLLFSDEYKKSLSDVFNLAIVAEWSEGVKEAFSEEEAEAFLAFAADYDLACKTTFMSEFDSFLTRVIRCLAFRAFVRHLAIGSWTHLRRLAFWAFVRNLAIGSWTHPGRLALWVFVRHLAIGSWTHPGRLAFRVFVRLLAIGS
nr:hypothetical protein [Tanacetum cinerariifolium]